MGHFKTTSWINDPNGLFFDGSTYHLFCQYNPNGSQWGHIGWCHAVSNDLVAWQRLDDALVASDEKFKFSGSVVKDEHNVSGLSPFCGPVMIAFYTEFDVTTKIQSQCLAFSLDDGQTWQEYDHNPIMDCHSTEWRDPSVFWHEESQSWIMLLVKAHRQQVEIFRSNDLLNWEFASVFGGFGSCFGNIWEVPALLQIPHETDEHQKRWCLLLSINHGALFAGSGIQYFFGDFDGYRFTPDSHYELQCHHPEPTQQLELKVLDKVLYLQVSGTEGTMSVESRLRIRDEHLGTVIIDELIACSEQPKVLNLPLTTQVGQIVHLDVDGEAQITSYAFLPEESSQFDVARRCDWMDFGRDFYAAIPFTHIKTAMAQCMGWINNWEYANDIPATPGRGTISFARNLRYTKRNNRAKLVQSPVTGDTRPPVLIEEQSEPLRLEADLAGQFSVRANIKTDKDFEVQLSSDDGDLFCIFYDNSKNQISLSRQTNVSNFREADILNETLTFDRMASNQEDLLIHLIIDEYVTEIFFDFGLQVATNLWFRSLGAVTISTQSTSIEGAPLKSTDRIATIN